MTSFYQIKEQAIADTPLLLFDCVLTNGTSEHWCTHSVSLNGVQYAARVMQQRVFEMQLSSDLGVDAIPKISLDLANADSHFSEIERSIGIKGTQLTVSIVFYSLTSGLATSTEQVLFKGLLNAPDYITEDIFRVSASNRLSLQRVVLPDTRIQKRCPWQFPTNLGERQTAANGGTNQTYSRLFKCGYSPDVASGVGNLDSTGKPFTSCTLTRSDCTARGMFNKDSAARNTARFGGIEFVPSTIAVRSAGEKGSHSSALSVNEARYNDFVPLIYGTVWHAPSIVFARNDGNLTRVEVLLGTGPVTAIHKVLVNNTDIPIGVSGSNMTGTGWYNVISTGQRNGAFNPDFTDGHGNPLGDPYGSMAFLSVVVPNRVASGSSLPDIRILLDGLQIPQYQADGTFLGSSFSNNPAWITLDLLARIGWSLTELDMASFAAAAAYCAEMIMAADLFGKPTSIPRFQCNVALSSKRAASDVLRGIRNGSRLFLRYGSNGLLQLVVEDSIALQQPTLPQNSNATATLNGGWPAYEFGDGTSGTSGIARKADRTSSVRLSSRSTADTPNRFVAEFQDAFNEYQQDSYSIVDVGDVALSGQEITSTLPVLGLANFDQAGRILQFYVSKTLHGNTFIEFHTSVKALGLAPGDIISLTYLKEGFERQPFRIVKLQPGPNYRTAVVQAQLHEDAWYYDTNGQSTNPLARRQSTYGIGLPRPLAGAALDGSGSLQFGVVEASSQSPDGTATVTASVSFTAPAAASAGAPGIPLLSLSSSVTQGAGSIQGPQELYYAITPLDVNGVEGALSFVVHVSVPSGSGSNAVGLTGLSFAPGTVLCHVYRGQSPVQLFRIASNVPLLSSFVDTGFVSEAALPPDANYDHANFYWRSELQPEAGATTFGPDTIGSTLLQMQVNEYAGATVRITLGMGVGQEAIILANTASTLSISNSWMIQPDASSSFVVVESTYTFGAGAKTSPIQFTIPNRAGNVIHLSGRSANCNDLESPYELAPLTRWQIGGAGIQNIDAAIAPAPIFGLSVGANLGGTLVLGALGFSDLSNCRTINTGTYRFHYLDEVTPAPVYSLVSTIDSTTTMLAVTPTLPTNLPAYLLLGTEILGTVGLSADGSTLMVKRSVHGSAAASHTAGTQVATMLQRTAVVPFVKNFFGSPASGDWSYPLAFPNVRIVSAELSVTNSQGDSPTSARSFSGLLGGGLRTLSGGQLSFQVSGFLAVQTGAAPDLIIDSPRVVRDIFAVVKQAPVGSAVTVNLNLNGTLYSSITIPAGAVAATAAIDGTNLGPMNYQDRLSIDVISVGSSVPASDLTVIVRV